MMRIHFKSSSLARALSFTPDFGNPATARFDHRAIARDIASAARSAVRMNTHAAHTHSELSGVSEIINLRPPNATGRRYRRAMIETSFANPSSRPSRQVMLYYRGAA